MSKLAPQLNGYRLTTAEILYHLPDHPGLLQTYVWQEYDLAPRYPGLRKFLDFWQRSLEGRLHSVTVGSTGLIQPGEIRHADISLSLH
ncbi:MAG: usg protein [Alphaproteobacteria bacterium]|nr:usg protein [Alphaproteobacteria bacterium]MBU0796148.1 usg protein [Alphaproteobacteria bacterium]MBU0888519.1 usg protein [Alphaproteobacteria bacterium]MBU1813018.1 usg protein [Alphaproteobacteria bacterium]MBU2089819.1 usg protein [Alphaproteobacteria bacterium]